MISLTRSSTRCWAKRETVPARCAERACLRDSLLKVIACSSLALTDDPPGAPARTDPTVDPVRRWCAASSRWSLRWRTARLGRDCWPWGQPVLHPTPRSRLCKHCGIARAVADAPDHGTAPLPFGQLSLPVFDPSPRVACRAARTEGQNTPPPASLAPRRALWLGGRVPSGDAPLRDPSSVVEVTAGREHFRTGEVTLVVEGTGALRVRQLRSGAERDWQGQLPAERLAALSTELAQLDLASLASSGDDRDPDDDPVRLVLRSGGDPPHEARLWYADRFADPRLDALLRRWQALTEEVTDGALPYGDPG